MRTEGNGRRQRVVRGQGTYLADLVRDGTLHACFIRSYEPYAAIRRVDLDRARQCPGVVAAYSWSDLESTVRPLRNEGPGLASYDWTALAADRVRYVGEPVAVVIADSPYAAEDAAEAVDLDLERLPFSLSAQEAADDQVLVHPSAGTNVLFQRSVVDPAVDIALAESDVVLERTFHVGRQTPFPLEDRGVIASTELATGKINLWTSTQIPHVVRNALATALSRSEESIRVITPDVGGGFGLKASVFPEEIVLSAVATLLPRPIAWVEDRRENLMASGHAHDEYMTVRLGANKDGRITAADIDVLVDIGAHSTYPFSASLEPSTTAVSIFATYDVPLVSVRSRGVATPKCPVGPYRGVGGPAAYFATERSIDILARELGVDPVEIRRINLVRPEQMPHVNAQGVHLDSGDYRSALEAVLREASYKDLRDKQAMCAKEGRFLGIGTAVFNEHSGPGSRAYRARGVASVPGFDSARVEMDVTGHVTIYASAAEAGQDHATSYSMIVAQELGIDPSSISVVEGDTASCPNGTGTFASRNGTAQLSAVLGAARKLKARLVQVAALLMECSAEAVEFAEGGFREKGGPGRVGLRQLASAAHLRSTDFVTPDGFEPGLEATASFDPEKPTYPYGAHLSLIELHPDTLSVQLVQHVAMEDCGRILNADAVNEQIMGGIVMGIGNALFEEVHYDSEGQIKTTTLLDYLVPLVTDVPRLSLLHSETPSARTPLGTKGVAEAGTIGAVAAIGCAIADALGQMGAGELNELPASPTRIFNAIDATHIALGERGIL